MKKGIMYKLSPFNNETNMSAPQYAIKKVMAFILIYGVSAVLGEGIIIGILYAMGYDPLHGVMPAGRFSGNPIEFFRGAFVAVILLFTIIGICCISGSISFCGFNTNVNIKNYLLWVCAFGIQGATEEIMCRGFLLNLLKTRISREASTKLELANELKEKVLTDENNQKAKKGLKHDKEFWYSLDKHLSEDEFYNNKR